MRVIIGGYTAEMGGSAIGVRSLVVDMGDDGAGNLDDAAELELTSPSYLIAHPEQPWLFAVTEGTPSLVHSLALAADGSLERLASRESGGEVGAHLALSPDSRYLVVAHYGSGSVSSFAVDERGRLSERLDLMTFDGSGPVPERQDRSRAHQVVFAGEELLVADLGTDRVHRIVLEADGRFRTSAEPVVLPAGSGPRHLVLIEDFLVVACELSAELWLGRRSDSGWTEVQRVAASTAEVDEPIYPSALRADGDQVFVANRGAGTIARVRTRSTVGPARPVDRVPVRRAMSARSGRASGRSVGGQPDQPSDQRVQPQCAAAGAGALRVRVAESGLHRARHAIA